MMRGDLLWRKAIQLLNKKYMSGGGDPVTGEYIQQHSAPYTEIISKEAYNNLLIAPYRAFIDGAYVNSLPPTVRNQCKCILPRHSCISYLKDVKIYESALGAEVQEEYDNTAGNLLFLKINHREIFEK